MLLVQHTKAIGNNYKAVYMFLITPLRSEQIILNHLKMYYNYITKVD